MRPSRLIDRSVRSLPLIFAAAMWLGMQTLPTVAGVPKSLLPAFGEVGKEFSTKAKEGNVIHEAFIMFIVHDPGTVDLAGIALEEKP